MASFIMPNLSELRDAAEKACTRIAEATERGDATFDFWREGSFVICSEPLANVDDAYNAMKAIWPRFKTLQPSIAEMGVLSGESKYKEGTTERFVCTPLLCKETLTLDHDVCELVMKNDILAELPDKGSRYSTVPSIYMCGFDATSNPPNWFFGHSTDECAIVAIVAVSPITISLVPHAAVEYAPKWHEMTFDGKANPRLKPDNTFLSRELCLELDIMHIHTITLEAGQVLITHRGMPLRFDAGDLLKLVSFSVDMKNSKIKAGWLTTITEGAFAPTRFREQVFHKMYSFSVGKLPCSEWLCAPAAPEDVPWLVGSVSSLAKKKNLIDDGDNNDDGDAVEKPQASKSKRAQMTAQKNQNYESLVQRHDTLLERINNLDGRSWNPKHQESAAERREKTTAASKSSELGSYKTVLDTLEGRVTAAEKFEATELPKIIEQIDEIGEVLRDLSDVPDNAKAIHKSRNQLQVHYDKYVAMVNNIGSGAKDIAKRHASAMALKAQAANYVPPKKRGRAADEPAKATSPTVQVPSSPPTESEPKRIAVAVMEIPELKLDGLEPFTTLGKTDGNAYFKELLGRSHKYLMLVEATKNAKIESLYKGFNASMKPVAEQLVKLANDDLIGEIDFAIPRAYAAVLDELRDAQIAAVSNGKPTARTAPARRVGKCGECGERRTLFGDSAFCGQCYRDGPLNTAQEELEERYGRLVILADKESNDNDEWSKKLTEFEKKFGDEGCKLTELGDAGAKPNGTFVKCQEFLRMYAEASAYLPEAHENSMIDDEDDEHADGDVEAEYNDHSDEDDRSKRRKHRVPVAEDPILSLKNAPEDDRSAKNTDESDEQHGSGSIADAALRAMIDLPIRKVHDEILEYYEDDARRHLLPAHLEKLQKVQEIFAVRLVPVKGSPDDFTIDSYHMTRSKANDRRSKMSIEGEIKGEVITVPSKKRLREEAK